MQLMQCDRGDNSNNEFVQLKYQLMQLKYQLMQLKYQLMQFMLGFAALKEKATIW